ncbi:hypothetical protein M8037_13325 [Sinorhizobium meliloti]|uniref:hypothetical protein n=1 Tax=Rhizobium meliloti TaxID=382 RepID=UPI0020733F98|nr:hypothetical protein [Sinorhizobium meliloti]MCM5689771.1 hypothetical protein [Sinorhizobium meliloti]
MRIEKAEVEHYGVYLKDKSRPPSRGGNKRAWHQHVLTIGGEPYSFLAAWSGKFVFKGEIVSFNWEWNDTQKYRNVNVLTVVAFDSKGNERRRGERGTKLWRTADTRPPGRRSEWGD